MEAYLVPKFPKSKATRSAVAGSGSVTWSASRRAQPEVLIGLCGVADQREANLQTSHWNGTDQTLPTGIPWTETANCETPARAKRAPRSRETLDHTAEGQRGCPPRDDDDPVRHSVRREAAPVTSAGRRRWARRSRRVAERPWRPAAVRRAGPRGTGWYVTGDSTSMAS